MPYKLNQTQFDAFREACENKNLRFDKWGESGLEIIDTTVCLSDSKYRGVVALIKSKSVYASVYTSQQPVEGIVKVILQEVA
jgi:hypothetical protein